MQEGTADLRRYLPRSVLFLAHGTIFATSISLIKRADYGDVFKRLNGEYTVARDSVVHLVNDFEERHFLLNCRRAYEYAKNDDQTKADIVKLDAAFYRSEKLRSLLCRELERLLKQQEALYKSLPKNSPERHRNAQKHYNIRSLLEMHLTTPKPYR